MNITSESPSISPVRRTLADDLGALLGMLCCAAVVLLAIQLASPVPLRAAGYAVDRLGAILVVLVSGIGLVCFRYAARCLCGHPRRGRFLALLAGAVLSAASLACASNLVVLVASWAATSLCLHGLLTFCRERPESRRPALKKFLISRIGDAALIAGVLLIARDWGTLDLRDFVYAAATTEDPASLRLPVLCIVIAALTKSAQFPFHSWLPETMESPTPVSALMHAGIINAGGVLLLRMAPAIARVPEAWILLSLAGSVTLVIGMVSMWAQVKVKRTLAWSTIAQMGFMMVQCGLLAFPAAFLHLVGHGCCKAWSFLRSGEVVGDPAPAPSPVRALALVSCGIASAVPAVVLCSRWAGVDLLERPGELALAAILSMAVGQLWSAALAPVLQSVRGVAVRGPLVLVGGWFAVLVAFSLYRASELFLAPVSAPIAEPTGWAAWLAASFPVAACLALTVLHALLPVLHRRHWGRALHVHALHGFYLGAIADRLVDAVTLRAPPSNTGARHA